MLRRISRTGIQRPIERIANITHDTGIRSYAISTLHALGVGRIQFGTLIQGNLPPMTCPETALEDQIMKTLLASLLTLESEQKILYTLSVIKQSFTCEYEQMINAFMNGNGVQILEEVILRFSKNVEVVQSVLGILHLLVQKMQIVIQLDQNKLIGTCIQVLLRYEKEYKLVKLSLRIIQSLCLYRIDILSISFLESSASTLVHYLDLLKSLLTQYQNTSSICESIIHILVLLSQIGSQSRLSIIRSNILENIDAVALFHVDRKSLCSNILTLFLELSDSAVGADTLVSVHCFEISVKIIQRLILNDRCEVENEMLVKAFQVIQSVVERGTNVMNAFLNTSGYAVIEEVWKANPPQLDIQQALLSALLSLLQHEEGNDALTNLSLPSLLLTEPLVNRLLVGSLWSCIRFFVQRHSKLITTTNLQQILQGAASYGKAYPQEEVFVFHLSWTLFTISSLRKHSINHSDFSHFHCV